MHKTLYVLTQYLHFLGYSVSQNTLEKRILSDPDNDITAVTNSLDFFQINNVVATVPKEALSQLPERFIAQIGNNNQFSLVLASKISDQKVQLLVDNNTSYLLDNEAFIHNWTGLIIAIEANESKAVKAIDKNLITKGLALFGALMMLSYIGFSTFSLPKVIYSLLAITGLILSTFIVKEKLGFGSIASKFCTISAKTDCQTVLTSDKATLFNLFELSDLSIIYFVSLVLCFTLNPNNIFLFFLSVASLPIIIYSLYEQYYTIKKWCPLCLGIASVLLLQFLTLLPVYKQLTFSYADIFSILAISSVTITGWMLLSPFLSEYSKNKEIAIEHLAFRRNYHLFLPFYNASQSVATKQGQFPEITLGSQTPLINIIAVTNPLCETCFEAHETYIKLLHTYPDKIQITLRFFVPYTNRQDPRTQIAERLLELYLESNPQVFGQALEEWYSKVTIQDWLGKWKTCEQIKYNQILGEQKKWCSEQNIHSTPSILINGKHFPQFYNPSDIENFIDSIIEFEENKIEHQDTIYA